MAYGFEINDAAGNVALDSSISTVRIVHTQFCLWDYNSSFSVPNFDSTKGEFYIKPHLVAADHPTVYTQFVPLRTTGTNYDYDFKDTFASTGGLWGAGYWLSFQNNNKPTLSWDNATKTMSVTPPSFSPMYRVTSTQSEDGGDYTIVFFEVA
jgi:hypothetical protein